MNLVITMPRAIPGPGRRAVSLVAPLSLLPAASAAWAGTADTSPRLALALAAAFLVTLLLAAVVLAAREGPTLRRVDVGSLVLGIVLTGLEQHQALFTTTRRYPSDEGQMGKYAITALLNGHNPYTARWPSLTTSAGNTPLLSGGSIDRYTYVPLSAEIGAGLHRVWAPLGTPGVVASLGLVATAVLCFVLLPHEWRALATAIVLGLGLTTTFAVNGHPVIVALPLLCVAAHRWTSIGAGGHLGGRGVLSAACLGLAAAAQQLSWFIAVALVLALFVVRRGASPPQRALMLVSRYAGLAALVFSIANLPFLLSDPREWVDGVLFVFTQPAVASGQGLVMLSIVVIGHSGHLEFYSYATVLLFLAILSVVVVGIRRVAPAVPALVALVFIVGTRSQSEYFVVFIPLWLVWLFGTDPVAVAASRPMSWQPKRVPRAFRHPALLTGLALLPALACVVVAVASPSALRLRLRSASLDKGRIIAISVEATNMSDHTLVPHFYVDPAAHIKSAWGVTAGPHSLSPGQHELLTLTPGVLGAPSNVEHLRLWALSNAPADITSIPIDVKA